MSSNSGSPSRKEVADVSMNDSIAPSRVLGIFGMSIFTRRGDLEKLFEEYGPIEKVEIIHNRQTGRSKGFGFVYFERQEDAELARLKTNGLELNERKIRVDFSRTESAHNPTPGFYNGKPIEEVRRERDDRSRVGRNYRDNSRQGGSDRHYVPRRRSRSRSHSRSRDVYRRRDDREYRRDDREYRRDEPREREYRRDDHRDREYRPTRRSPSPRRD